MVAIDYNQMLPFAGALKAPVTDLQSGNSEKAKLGSDIQVTLISGLTDLSVISVMIAWAFNGLKFNKYGTLFHAFKNYQRTLHHVDCACDRSFECMRELC